MFTIVVDDVDLLDRQPLEPRIVAARESQKPGDDLHRKREGELAGQLGSPARREPVDELVDHQLPGLPPAERSAILGGTAARLFGVPA